ncbi:MAG: M15 family metallopeptidase [Acetatifactor sp.]|nr:M15 family metallopeptidase [Acetatifactor sp.]
MNQRRNALLKGLAAIAAVIVICISLGRIIGIGSQTLGDIAREHPQPTATPRNEENAQPGESQGETEDGTQPRDPSYDIQNTPASGGDVMTDNLQNMTENDGLLSLPGLALNGEFMADARITWEEGFYYEPLSQGLADYITGVSYPKDLEKPAIAVSDLCYIHVLYNDFEGNPAEGELICNQAIAQDLVEIFHELYKAEYQIEKIRLIDAYGGDDDLSMADNNSSCFNYRVVSGSSSLSRHAYGLAIDINPLYNPYITYNKDQTIHVSPEAGEDYADRSKSFPYKIDEEDLCYRLFKEHGFTWGGDWNSCKDYQHFQKTP